MKEVKEVEIPQKTIVRKATTKKVVKYTCDICGKSIDKSQDNRYGSGMSQCSICGRDVCRTDTTAKDRENQHSRFGEASNKTCFFYDPDEYGDYPEKYCIICFPLFVPARREMNERHWKEEEKLEARIRKESLANGKTH